MSSSCFKFNLTRNKSKSNEASKLSLSIHSNSNSINKCLPGNSPESFKSQNISETCLVSPTETIIKENPNEKVESRQDQSLDFHFDPTNMKLFSNQNIAKIRRKNQLFEDNRFLRFISSIVEDEESKLYISLASRFQNKNLIKLNRLIKWQRAQEICEALKLSYEFALDNDGNPPSSDNPVTGQHYTDFFNTYDINQSWIWNR